MNSAVNQAFERMKVSAIEKILSDGRTLAVQAAAVAEVLSHYAKVQEEFRRHFEVVKFTAPRAQFKTDKLKTELDAAWISQNQVEGSETITMRRSQFAKRLAHTHDYNIRTAWRRINDMVLGGLIVENGEYLQRLPAP